MSNGLTFEILTRISQHFHGMLPKHYIRLEWLQNFVKIARELTEQCPKSLLSFWTRLHRQTDCSLHTFRLA